MLADFLVEALVDLVGSLVAEGIAAAIPGGGRAKRGKPNVPKLDDRVRRALEVMFVAVLWDGKVEKAELDELARRAAAMCKGKCPPAEIEQARAVAERAVAQARTGVVFAAAARAMDEAERERLLHAVAALALRATPQQQGPAFRTPQRPDVVVELARVLEIGPRERDAIAARAATEAERR